MGKRANEGAFAARPAHAARETGGHPRGSKAPTPTKRVSQRVYSTRTRISLSSPCHTPYSPPPPSFLAECLPLEFALSCVLLHHLQTRPGLLLLHPPPLSLQQWPLSLRSRDRAPAARRSRIAAPVRCVCVCVCVYVWVSMNNLFCRLYTHIRTRAHTHTHMRTCIYA